MVMNSCEFVTVQVGLRTLLRRIASPLGRKTVRMSKTGIAPSNLHAELAGSCNRSAPLAELLRKFAQKCSEKLCLEKIGNTIYCIWKKATKKMGKNFWKSGKMVETFPKIG